MEQGYTTREWLDWLTRVRLLMIALILPAIGGLQPLLPAFGNFLDNAGHSPHYIGPLAAQSALARTYSSSQ